MEGSKVKGNDSEGYDVYRTEKVVRSTDGNEMKKVSEIDEPGFISGIAIGFLCGVAATFLALILT